MRNGRCERSGWGLPPILVIIGTLLLSLSAAPARASYNRIQVPIRWCVVQGSPASQSPACACQPSAAFVLLSRGIRATVSYRNCAMLFRGGAMRAQSGMIIGNARGISDPCDPAVNPSCPGQTGDIFVDLSTNNLTEYFQAVNACRQAWNQSGISAPGLIGVNLRRFVNAAGTQANVYGLGGVPIFNNAASQAVAGQFAVMDDDYFLDFYNFPGLGNVVANSDTNTCQGNFVHPAAPPCAPQVMNDGLDVLTAHELGHSLSLPHLASTAMAATLPSAVLTPRMTTGGPGSTALVCPPQPLVQPTSQCGQLRLQSICHQNGTIVDPPPVVDEEPLAIGDASPGWTDLELVGLIDDSNTNTAGFFWRAVDPFPANATGLSFEVALDLDQNPISGGDPSTVGINVPLTGAELAGSVTVDVLGGSVSTVETLWRWDDFAMSFVPEITLGSSAENGEVWADDFVSGTAATVPVHAIVQMSFDAGLLVGPSSAHTFRVRAFDPAGGVGDMPAEGELYMVDPDFSICDVLPQDALPGDAVTVEASDLVPNAATRILFDLGGVPVHVASGMTDPTGFSSTGFTVPMSTDPGFHVVRVVVEQPGSELSSVCSLNVLPPAGPAGESSEVDPLLVTAFDTTTGEMDIDFGPACAASRHAVYTGRLEDVGSYLYDGTLCDIGNSGSATIELPDSQSRFFLVIGQNETIEGSYGHDGTGAERPEAVDLVSTCELPQDLASTCVP